MFTASPNSVDVLVVGAGPAGLATAIAARQHGFRVLVADGTAPPVDKACGEGLMPDGVDALHQLGVVIPESQSRPFRGIRFVNGSQKAEAAFPVGTAVGVRRTVLHQILLDHATSTGVSVMWRAPVTGLHPGGAMLARNLVRASWVVGADGAMSRVRQWAKLDAGKHSSRRFAARRHYRVAPWTDFMELHWGHRTQIYVTAVGPKEVCVAAISDKPRVKLQDALTDFPELLSRLENAPFTSPERGAVTISRRLPQVYRERTVLVGDASAGVDAITGEGLCLAFRQAVLLGECLAAGDLGRYQAEHRRLIRRPALMARLMLLMGNHHRLRERTMNVFQSRPSSLAAMLAMHIGAGTTPDYVSNGISLGWRLLTTT